MSSVLSTKCASFDTESEFGFRLNPGNRSGRSEAERGGGLEPLPLPPDPATGTPLAPQSDSGLAFPRWALEAQDGVGTISHQLFQTQEHTPASGVGQSGLCRERAPHAHIPQAVIQNLLVAGHRCQTVTRPNPHKGTNPCGLGGLQRRKHREDASSPPQLP